ncbi:hypothetical protein SPAN111604_03600 [Sphingomonas antarctica]|uniref:hypothetical protein n=1 Tax=Sphingomonas antarctica TaxID=2040274 RepID=UPI0039ECA34E
MTNVIIFNIVLLSACGFALVRGAAPERTVAVMMLLAALAGFATQNLGRRYEHVELSVTLIDLALLVGLIAVALRANRFWPMWLASLHIVAVAFQGVRAYIHDLPGWSYQRAVSLIAYPMLLILIVGCQRHFQRAQRRGSEPSWSPLI